MRALRVVSNSFELSSEADFVHALDSLQTLMAIFAPASAFIGKYFYFLSLCCALILRQIIS